MYRSFMIEKVCCKISGKEIHIKQHVAPHYARNYTYEDVFVANFV